MTCKKCKKEYNKPFTFFCYPCYQEVEAKPKQKIDKRDNGYVDLRTNKFVRK